MSRSSRVDVDDSRRWTMGPASLVSASAVALLAMALWMWLSRSCARGWMRGKKAAVVARPRPRCRWISSAAVAPPLLSPFHTRGSSSCPMTAALC